jgi:hypothetical protein
MRRVQLFYKDISDIIGSNGFSVMRLTDAEQQRAICIICDKMMTEQLTIRFNKLPDHDQMLPEVLTSMLLADGSHDFEMMIYDVVDGQYRTTLLNKRTLTLRNIRISDAVLLHFISKIPIYIEEGLMNRQCSPFVPESTGLSIPINTIDTEHLNLELDRAIENEDYRLASHLHEELQRRIRR